MKLKKLWHYAARRVLKRKVPHTLLSTAFLRPRRASDTPELLMHRRVFFEAWRDVPRLLYVFIAVYGALCWYTWYGWRSYQRARNRAFTKILSDEGVPAAERYKRLWFRAFLRGFLPRHFLKFKLYQQEPADWWLAVPSNSLPHWHLVYQGRIGKRAVRIMSNKRFFAEQLAAQGVAVVPLLPVPANQKAWAALLEQYPAGLFLKPEMAARAEGCFALRRSDDTWHLISKDGEIEKEGRAEIANYIQHLVAATPYLVQPRVINHPDLAGVPEDDSAIVFRIITLRMPSGEVRVWRSNIEVPLINRVEVKPYRVDVKTGSVPKLENLQVPYWHSLRELVVKAHEAVPDLKTIGWDAVISENGPMLLEGNINWGTDGLQGDEHPPFLDADYMDCVKAP